MRTLSQLSEDGAKLVPLQGRGKFVGERTHKGPPSCACLLGGALFAQYGEALYTDPLAPITLLDHLDEALIAAHGRGVYTVVRNPVTRKYEPLSAVIMDLNDKRLWSRARIVAWLREEGY